MHLTQQRTHEGNTEIGLIAMIVVAHGCLWHPAVETSMQDEVLMSPFYPDALPKLTTA